MSGGLRLGLRAAGLAELVARDSGVDETGPGVDASGDGLGLVEALLTEPGGDGERAGSVVAEDEDGGVFFELLVGAGGDFVHGDEGGGGDIRGGVLPGLADVEEERRVLGGEEGLELGYGDFEVHTLKDTGGATGRARGFAWRAMAGG